MPSPNDQGPFSPTDHNILVEDKRPSILNASAPPHSPYPLTVQEILSPSNRLYSPSESYIVNNADSLSAVPDYELSKNG